jgi:Flp pilus assembly pilin Flp
MLLLRTTALYVRARFGQLRADQGGVTAVEYALMVAIIALLMVAGFWLLFSNVKDSFTNTGECVDSPATVPGGGCAP